MNCHRSESLLLLITYRYSYLHIRTHPKSNHVILPVIVNIFYTQKDVLISSLQRGTQNPVGHRIHHWISLITTPIQSWPHMNIL